MDFFNKAKSTISSKSKDVAKKAKGMAEVASLNSQISSKETAIKALYLEIGKLVYETQKDAATGEVAEKIQNIDAYMTEIEGLKAQIKTVKGVTNCEECGAELADGVAFCPKCGKKVPEKLIDAVVEAAEAATETAAEEAKEETNE